MHDNAKNLKYDGGSNPAGGTSFRNFGNYVYIKTYLFKIALIS